MRNQYVFGGQEAWDFNDVELRIFFDQSDDSTARKVLVQILRLRYVPKWYVAFCKENERWSERSSQYYFTYVTRKPDVSSHEKGAEVVLFLCRRTDCFRNKRDSELNPGELRSLSSRSH